MQQRHAKRIYAIVSDRMPFQPGHKKTGGKKKGSVNGKSLARLQVASEHITATVDRVLSEYSHIAFLDIGEAFAADGSLLPIHEMPENVRRAIAGIEVASLNIDNDGKGEVGKLHKIKLLDKGKALQDLAKHLGMFIERIAGADGGPIQTKHEIVFVRPADRK